MACRRSGYLTSANLAFGAPQTEHLSGALPVTVLPHTVTDGRSGF